MCGLLRIVNYFISVLDVEVILDGVFYDTSIKVVEDFGIVVRISYNRINAA